MSQHAPGYCDGHNSDVFIPAVYLWVCALNGNEVELCVECCAAWRLNAASDPALAASSITQLSR